LGREAALLVRGTFGLRRTLWGSVGRVLGVLAVEAFDDLELDAAILRTAFLGGVVGDRLIGTLAFRLQAFLVDALFD
jgi:hypothetical protein